MSIPTLSRYLYEVNKQRPYLQLKEEKRKAALYLLGITVCVTISVLLWTVYA